MGLHPSSIRLFLQLHSRYSFKGPVLTFGNQEIWASYNDLISYFHNNRLPFNKPDEIVLHTSRIFKQDPDLAIISDQFVHAKVLFGMLGISEYYDMDKFESDSPSILHDLNLQVPNALHNRFSLIVDGGTIEHIFDVRQVMENILTMLKPDGCIVHISSFNMDHGFYAFSPCFFFDFYTANGFTDFSCYILQTDTKNIIKNYRRRNPVFEYLYGMPLEKMIDPKKQILVFFTARRIEVKKTMVIPTQGIFDPDNVGVTDVNKRSFCSYVPPTFHPLVQPFRLSLLGIKSWVNNLRIKNSVKIRNI
jgi:hypothetical protein